MRPTTSALAAVLLTGCVAAAGPTTAPTTLPATAAAPVRSPGPAAPAAALVHLPGIAGEMRIDHDLIAGLVAGGVAPAGSIVDWTGVDRGVPALTNVERHHAEARKLATLIAGIVGQRPRPRLTLTAHSAGTGVAVEALELLPADVKIDTLVLLASALSPEYDLSAALRHVDGRAVSLHSAYDRIVLGVGTRTFGTYDRLRTDAAGFVGFRPPQSADPAAYAKLIQIPYDPRWTTLGHGGDHIGMTNRRFARLILAPLIAGRPLPTTWPTLPRP